MDAATGIDLTTLQQVKDWLAGSQSSTSTVDNDKLQLCITAFSLQFVWRTGRDAVLVYDDDGNLTDDSASPFVKPIPYDEFYDGGPRKTRLFLNNGPINSVQLVKIRNVTVPAITTPSSPGYGIHQDRKSLFIRGDYLFGGGCDSRANQQCVEVQYTAGYKGTPIDITLAAAQAVGVNYVRRGWIDLASQTLSSGNGVQGTVKYRDWEWPPEIRMAIRNYSRQVG